MKKKLLYGFLGILTVITIASCNKGKEVFNGTVIDQNLPTEEVEQNPITELKVQSLASTKVFDKTSDLEVYADYYNNGFLLVKNKYNYVGVYSLIKNAFVVAPMFYEPWIQDYEVKTISYFGGCIGFEYQGKTYIFDTFGNLLYDGEEEVDVLENIVNGKCYLQISGENEDLIYEYDGLAGNVKQVSERPTPKDEEFKDEEVDEDKLNKGDLFVGDNLDLTPYGMEGYYMVNSGCLYTVFDVNNTKVSTFVLPEDVNVAFIGGKLIYQTQILLPEDAKDYSFSAAGNNYLGTQSKYKLNTYAIDVKTGAKEELKFDYILYNCLPYKDKNGVMTYGLAYLGIIGDSKEIKSQDTYLINEKGQLVQNLSGYEVSFFTKLSNDYYYNEHTDVLYSPELVEVAYLGDMNPLFDEENQVFIGLYEGKYGVVDMEGKVLVPFEYTSLTPLENSSELKVKESCIIASKSVFVEQYNDNITQYYRLNLSTGESTYLGTNVSKVDTDLYLSKTAEAYIYLSQSKDYATMPIKGFDIDDTNNYITRNYDLNNGSYVFTKTVDTEKEFNEVKNGYVYSETITYNAFVKNPFKFSFTSYGTEQTTEYRLGNTALDSESVTLGKNVINIPRNSSQVYYNFKALNDATYFISSSDMSVSVYNEMGNSVSVSSNIDGYSFNAEKGVTYFIQFNNYNGEKYSSFELTEAFHANESNPLILSLNETSGVVTPYNGYGYVRIEGLSSSNPSTRVKISVNNNAVFDVFSDSSYYYSLGTGVTSYNYDLTSGTLYLKVYYSNSETKSNATVSITPDKTVTAGQSFLNTVGLKDKTVQNQNPNIVNLSTEQFTVLSFKNNSTTASVYNISYNSDRSLSYGIYDNEYVNMLGSSLYSGYSFTKEVVILPKETVYLYLKNTSYSYGAEVNVEVEKLSEVKTMNPYSIVNFNFNETKNYYYQFKLDMNRNHLKELANLSYDSYNGSVNVSYLDKSNKITYLSSMEKDKTYFVKMSANVSGISLSGTYQAFEKPQELKLGTYSTDLSYDYSINGSYNYVYNAITNTTSNDMVIMINSHVVTGYYNVPTPQLSVTDSLGNIIYGSNGLYIIPANSTYYVSSYITSYNSSYDYRMYINVNAIEQIENTLEEMDFSLNAEEYKVFYMKADKAQTLYLNISSEVSSSAYVVYQRALRALSSSSQSLYINSTNTLSLNANTIYIVIIRNNSGISAEYNVKAYYE